MSDVRRPDIGICRFDKRRRGWIYRPFRGAIAPAEWTIRFLFQVFFVELFELVEWNGFRIVVKIYVGGSGDDQ